MDAGPHDELNRLLADLPPEVAERLRALWPSSENAPTVLLPAPGPRLTTQWITEGLLDADDDGQAVIGPPDGDRYRFLERLGEGGFAEVWRVHDTVLDRHVAMKVVHGSILVDPSSMRRFLAEAHATARLQHPNIVPVYDVGRLDDGRVWFTMREVHGETLRTWLQTGPPLARRLSVFLSMCHGLAYAHQHGVVHRDVKPSNVMLGSAGEVYVLDWGIAKFLGDALPVGPVTVDGPHTVKGWVGGTPGYMAPEQASGRVAEVDQRADVFALGCVLYELIEGRPAYEGGPYEVLRATIDGPPPPLWDGHDPELRHIVERAMARDPADRYPDAAGLVAPVQAWLEGAERRGQALELTRQAVAQQERAAALRRQAERLRQAAARALEGIPTWAPEADKVAAWETEDQARAVALEAELADQDVELGLQAALRLAPDLAEAHAVLVQRTRAAHEAAEQARDATAARRLERQLTSHTGALPLRHPARASAEAYLRGDGTITLHTEPPGAEVELHRVVTRTRRRVATFERHLGTTPLRAEPVAHGSYVLHLRADGHAPVRFPVFVPRLGHVIGIPPGATQPAPVPLPPIDELGDDERYVPPGWFAAGSNECGLPPRRLWVDGFVVQRFPVTNRAYLAFLDALVAAGRTDEALQHAPRERSGSPGVPGALLVGFDGTRFALRPDAQGDLWDPAWPVVQVDWHGARAYAAWLAERTGKPWRLPSEFEWEKAARGVDGRRYPWGEELDPCWTHIAQSRPGRGMPQPVDTYPHDVSVYDVRGMGGNVQDWCLERFDADPPADGARLVPDIGSTDGDPLRMARGAGWDTTKLAARCAARTRAVASYRSWLRGFRLVRPWPG